MSSVPKQVSNTLQSLVTLTEAGIIRLQRPDRALRTAISIIRWGVTPAAGYEASAARYPDEVALIDELGQLTFREIQQRTNSLAHALADDGVNEGDNVAIMARNHRGFVEAVVACSKLGAHALFLNTSFSGPQLADVAEREKPKAIIYDEEFAEVLADAGHRRKRYISWARAGGGDQGPDARAADRARRPRQRRAAARSRARRSSSPPAPPARPRAPRAASRSRWTRSAALLSRIPLKAREKTMIAAPLFHAWGFAHFTLGMGLSSTIVLKRKFDEEATLSLTAQHGCTALVVVPVMLQRILELDDEILDRYDLSRRQGRPGLRLGAAGLVVERWMDHFGDNLFNLYGSTEVAWATIATPKDLRDAPGTAGKPPRGTVVRIYDDEGQPVEDGETGRIFVGNDLQFEGYTGGGNKDVIDGLMSSGDVGHFDDEGRLFVDGRDDDMIVSGGENVFPQEVEELLEGHDSIKEAAVFGVDDEKFGQRLKAVVVTKEEDVGRARSRSTSRRTSPATRSRATSSSSTSSRARRPARCSSGSSKRTSRGLNDRYNGGMAQRTDIFSLGRLGLSSGEGRRLDLHATLEPYEFGGEPYIASPAVVPVRLDISRTTGNGYALRLRFSAALEGPACAASARRRRCSRSTPARCTSPAAATSCSSDYVDEHDDLDLRAWVRDAFALAQPGQITCTPECLGLCPRCGANLNEDPEPHAHEARAATQRWAQKLVRASGTSSPPGPAARRRRR